MSSLAEREPRAEERISVREFLGVRRRLMPVTKEGRLARRDYWFSWRNEPPYIHEEAVFSAWIRSVEELSRGGALSQHYRDLSTLLRWISLRSFPEPMPLYNTKARRRISPPFLEPENRGALFLQSHEVLSFCGREFHDREAIAMLEKDLDILRQAGLFTLSEEDLRRSAAGIQQEISAKKI